MSNTLAQTAVRLDLPRGLALVEPVVERRSRRWDPQHAEDGSETTSAERAGAAGGTAALRAQEPIDSEQGPLASKMLSEADSSAEAEAKAKELANESAETPRPLPEPACAEKHREAEDQTEGTGAQKPVPTLATAGPQATQRKPPAPPSPPLDRTVGPPALAARQPQQVVAAPNVKLAGFLEASAEHTASHVVTGRKADCDNRDVVEPREIAVRFPRAALASDSAAQPGAAAVRTDAGHSDSPEREAADGLTTPVKILFKPLPRYPEQALEQHLQGDVLVDVEFRYSGTLEVLGVRQGLSPRLNESALEAARKIRFQPARRDGRPVDTQATVCIRFQLDP